MAMQLGKREEEWVRKRVGPFRLVMTKNPDVQFLVGRQFLGQVIDTIRLDPPSPTPPSPIKTN